MTTVRIERWRITVLGMVVGLAVIGLGFLEVILSARVRFDLLQGTALHSTEAAALKANAAPWEIHLQRVDAALTQKDVSAAERAWNDAYGTALGSRRWDGLVEVGDAYLRIGEAAKGRKIAEAKARTLYLAALFRARQEGSLDGVLRTTEAFHALGDREVVEQGLRIAERLAAQTGGAEALERVHALKERWAGLRLMAESANAAP